MAELRESARRVLPHVELDQIYAYRTNFKTHSRTVSPPFRTETDLRIMGRMKDGHVEVWSHYTTDAYRQVDEQPREDVWTAEVEGVAVFGLTVEEFECTEDDLEAFALLVGAQTLHPYAREWTQMLTSQSQYPAFTLGLLDSIAELPDEHEVALSERPEDSEQPSA